MKSFTLLWSSILDSSLWVGSTKEARLVWICLLALKDKNGEVHCSMPGLAHRAVVSLEECQGAVEFLSSPDPLSQNRDEEGRRIVPIEGGWRVVSHEKYRASNDAKAYWREAKARERNRGKKSASSEPPPGQTAYLMAENAGASPQQLDAITDDSAAVPWKKR